MLSFFRVYVRTLDERFRKGDQAGFYERLKTMNLEWKRNYSSLFIKDEDGNLLRDVELIRERWVRWFHTFLNTKSHYRSSRSVARKHTAGSAAHDAGVDR